MNLLLPNHSHQIVIKHYYACCEKLRTLRLDPTPCHPHEGKFEADLRAGFSYQEAKILQKTRDRAARHQAALAEMKGVSLEDVPKSWRDDAELQRTLKPGLSLLSTSAKRREWGNDL